MKKALIVLIAAALAAGGWFLHQSHRAGALPDNVAVSNGRLELKRIDVATLYSGRVESVEVEEGRNVRKGDILVRLSAATSSGQLEAAEAQQQRSREALARAEAEAAAYAQQLKVAEMEYANTRKLRSEDLVSDAEVDRRRIARDGAAASLKAARAARAEAAAAVAAAKAQTGVAAAANNDMTVRAPIDGRVEYRLADPGNVVGAGSRVISLLDPDDVRMNIFLPTDRVSPLRVGDQARIVIDGIDAVFPASIRRIADQNQFTPKSVETESERDKLMFKVELAIPAQTARRYNGLLKGGITGNGYVISGGSWPPELNIRLPKPDPDIRLPQQ